MSTTRFRPMATGIRLASKSVWGSAIIFLFGVPFAAVGVWLGTRLGTTIAAYRAAQQWEEVPAKIIQAEFKDEDSGEGRTYWVKAEYEYQYRGQRYTGRRVSLHGGSDNIGSFWWDVYRHLEECRRTGRPFRCYVNPAQPAQALLYRDLRPEMVIFQAGLAFMFAGAGFGLLIAAPFAFFAMRREETLAAAHPGEPWLWRADWAKGEIRSPGKSLVVRSIVFTAAFNLISVPVALLLLNDLVHGLHFGALLAMIFPVGGLALVAWPVAVGLRWRKFGRSVFKMASVPGVIGGELAGVVYTSAKIRPKDGFRLTLTCSNDSDESPGVFWHDEQAVVHDLLRDDPERSAIPVLFQIPFECRPSETKPAASWELVVKAAVPGIDYRAAFDVPVFETPQSNPSFVPSDRAIAPYAAPPDPERDLRDAGVLKTASPAADGWRFVFSMHQSFGFTVFALACLVVCSGALFFMLRVQAPADVSIMLGLVDVLILWLLVKIGFYRSVVDVSGRGLAVAAGPFGLGRRYYVPVSEITRIEAVRAMGNIRRNLILHCHGGNRLTIAKRLPSHRLATAAIREIEQALGRHASA